MNKKYVLPFSAAFLFFTAMAAFALSGLAASFDEVVTNWVQATETAALTTFLKIITTMGEWFVYLPTAGLLLIIPKSRIKVGVPAAITLMISAASNTLLKMIFAVPRPNVHRLIQETGFGFPSGHAMIGTAFIGTCMILFLLSSFQTRYKVVALAGAIVFLLLIGISRIYLGVHNPSDVLAGYAAGICVCCATGLALNILKNKQKKHQPSAT